MTLRIILLPLALILAASCSQTPESKSGSDPDACACAKDLHAKGESAENFARCKELRADSTFDAHFALCTAAIQMGKPDTTGMTLGKPSNIENRKPTDGNYALVVGQEKINWTGAKPNGKSHSGTVNAKSGKLAIVGEKLKSGEIILDMTTLTTDGMSGDSKGRLEGHLKSEDFFDSKKFPEAKFTITTVQEQDGGVFLAVGQITIKGISKQASAIVGFIGAGENALVCSGKLDFDRSQFDVRYGSDTFFDNLGDDMINNEINITFNFLAKK